MPKPIKVGQTVKLGKSTGKVVAVHPNDNTKQPLRVKMTSGPDKGHVFSAPAGAARIVRTSDARGKDGATTVTTGTHRSDTGKLQKAQDVAMDKVARKGEQLQAQARKQGFSAQEAKDIAEEKITGTKEWKDSIKATQTLDSSVASSGKPQSVGTKRYNKARKASKSSGGGNTGDQPRVPAGSPDGGEWTKK